MKDVVQKINIVSNIYIKSKKHHISIKYGDNINIDLSNQSTIYNFLHTLNKSKTNLFEINN